jgi:serine protease Do
MTGGMRFTLCSSCQSAAPCGSGRCATAVLLRTQRRTLLTMSAMTLSSLFGFSRDVLAHPHSELTSLISSTKPSVFPVGVYSRLQKPAFRFVGTCFAAGGQRFVTCAHVAQVIDPGAREILTIAVPETAGIRIVEMRVVASSRETDLALLAPVGTLAPQPRPLALAAEIPAEGSDVVLIGYPIGNALGLNAASHRGLVAAVVPMAMPMPTTTGLEARNVQALRQAPIEILQLDATAYPGNSGGPVIDIATGLVVAVVSLALVKGTRESAISSPSGISYAVPVTHLSDLFAVR